MRNLDLKQIGVQELSTVEVRETDGGFFETLLGALLAYAIIDAVENPGDFWDGLAYTL